jgi:Phosphotransferase enzyme family
VTGRPIVSGKDADVFALGEDRVLRRCRAGGAVAVEVASMRHVADHGFPVPAMYRAEGTELVVARVPGPTMLAALRAGDIGTSSAGRAAEFGRRSPSHRPGAGRAAMSRPCGTAGTSA